MDQQSRIASEVNQADAILFETYDVTAEAESIGEQDTVHSLPVHELVGKQLQQIEEQHNLERVSEYAGNKQSPILQMSKINAINALALQRVNDL